MVSSGQGIAGVSVAASSILSSLTGTIRIEEDETSDRSALMYFLTALIVTVAALAGHVILAQQPFYLHHMKQQDKTDNDNDNDHDPVDRPRPLRRLAEKSSCLLFTVAFVFVVTLMIFPSITSMIKSIHRQPSASRIFDDDIFVAMHFLLFNIGDWLGRILPLYISTFNPSVLLVLASLRVLFVPLFLVCNVVATERNMPVLIRSDGAYFVLLGLFSMTSGWVCSLTMMAAPQQPFLRSSTEKSLVGSLMSFSLVVGLAIGGSLSFWTRSMV
jgi:equilibrative nucleoside transporter 1/2/3